MFVLYLCINLIGSDDIFLRLNFTLEDLDVACPAYNHFIKTLSCHSGLKGRRLEADFPQFFEYDRVKELVSEWNFHLIDLLQIWPPLISINLFS